MTKITVEIMVAEDAEPVIRRWTGRGAMTNPEVRAEIGDFLLAYDAQRVVMTERILGCPHEEEVDYPMGEDCPHCPFWKGKQ